MRALRMVWKRTCGGGANPRRAQLVRFEVRQRVVPQEPLVKIVVGFPQGAVPRHAQREHPICLIAGVLPRGEADFCPVTR